ncbi:hypothetical protein JW711_03870 [Candidatus Woesearchaeota archaeon]|nr:hypothetical protein [Candidatus Woesearchaeota archaeon]
MAIRLEGNKLLERLEGIVAMGEGIDRKIEESKEKTFDRDELDVYLDMYVEKGLSKRIANQFRSTLRVETSAYDLSCRMTRLCQSPRTGDASRQRVEYIAGESSYSATKR